MSISPLSVAAISSPKQCLGFSKTTIWDFFHPSSECATFLRNLTFATQSTIIQNLSGGSPICADPSIHSAIPLTSNISYAITFCLSNIAYFDKSSGSPQTHFDINPFPRNRHPLLLHHHLRNDSINDYGNAKSSTRFQSLQGQTPNHWLWPRSDRQTENLAIDSNIDPRYRLDIFLAIRTSTRKGRTSLEMVAPTGPRLSVLGCLRVWCPSRDGNKKPPGSLGEDFESGILIV